MESDDIMVALLYNWMVVVLQSTKSIYWPTMCIPVYSTVYCLALKYSCMSFSLPLENTFSSFNTNKFPSISWLNII